MKRVVIIGGGIAGLSTAYFLIQEAREKGIEDLEVTLLEKSGKTGGNIVTEEVDGFLIEGGPDCFLSEKPWAMALCKRLGLGDRLQPTSTPRGRTFVLSRGRLHLLPEGVILMVPTKMLPMVTSTLISIPGKIRMGLELFIPRRKEKGDETLGAFVRRRLGREALDKIAEPLVAGVHAGDPDFMSIRASFPKFVEMEEQYGSLIKGMLARMAGMKGGSASKPDQASTKAGANAPGMPGMKKPTMFVTLKGGLTDLTEAIIAKIYKVKGVVIKTETAVKTIREVEDGYEVELAGNETIGADVVIAATPAYVTSELLKDVDAALSEKLTTIPYVSTATVSIGFNRAEVSHPLDGFGFVVPRTEGRRIMAASWSSVKWAGRAPDGKVLIRCFVGGASNAELVELSDEEMTAMVREELKDIMGIEAEPVLVRIFRWRRAMPQYNVGHEERVADIEGAASGHPGLYLTGSAFRGIGISDTVREAEAVAKKVALRLS